MIKASSIARLSGIKESFALVIGMFGIRAVVVLIAALAPSFSLIGCSASQPIPEESYRRSLALVDHGVRLLRHRKLPEAEAVFELAYEIAPLSAALDGKGCVAVLRGDYESAERLFVSALESDSTYNQALGNLALVYELTGRIAKAARVYRAGLTRNGSDPAVRHNLAALEFDSRVRSGADRGAETKRTLNEFLKAQALSGHAVIRENIDWLKGNTRDGQ